MSVGWVQRGWQRPGPEPSSCSDKAPGAAERRLCEKWGPGSRSGARGLLLLEADVALAPAGTWGRKCLFGEELRYP